MDAIKISFTLCDLPTYGIAHKNGRKTFEFQAFDGILTCTVPYDYDRRPLEVNAEVNAGDRIDLVLLPHRIGLYVNEILSDEEWPAGNRLFTYGDAIEAFSKVEVTPYTEPSEASPAVLSCFENAEGWYPGNGVFVGDCMPYEKDGRYHVLYLKDRHHHKSKWGLGAHQWEHISTDDFSSWQIHPTAVPITDPSEGSICTGSWIRYGSKEYLYYTVRRGKGLPAPIRRSVSLDGYHFEKDPVFGFTISDRYYASSARDPKIVLDGDGFYHMFLTTRLVDENRGCLAHFVSRDMDLWEDVGEPIYVAPDAAEPECPDYFTYRGKYYLIFSLHGKAHYMVSERPFSGFREPENAIIPCESVPKAAIFDGRLIFTGFRRMNGYAGAMTFRTATAAEDGTLIFS